MKKNLFFLPGIFLLSSLTQSCEKENPKVEPVVTTFSVSAPPVSSDAISSDKFGNIYASDNLGTSNDPFNGNGTTVYKITPTGKRTVFAEGIEGPTGSCFDPSGNFFVCAFQGGKLIKMTPGGTKQVFATGLEGPIQVVSDSKGNLFVSVAGIGELPGTKIYKFTPEGNKSVLVDLLSQQGIALSGLTIDKNDNLYVANYVNGIIHKITPQGAASVFSNLSGLGSLYTPFTSYLTYSGGNIYATGLVANRIYKINSSGVASVLAGTGEPGGTDGDPLTATFTGPNGITVEPFGNVLVVSETVKRLRRIVGLKKL